MRFFLFILLFTWMLLTDYSDMCAVMILQCKPEPRIIVDVVLYACIIRYGNSIE